MASDDNEPTPPVAVAAGFLDDEERRIITELVRQGLPRHHRAGPVGISTVTDANRGGGVFSRVLRIEFEPDDRRGGSLSVVVKLPPRGPNRMVAAGSGACRREAYCYHHLLDHHDPLTARAYAIIEHGDGAASFLLEDLTSRRWPDQIAGLAPHDAVAVVGALARLHGRWRDDADLPQQLRDRLAPIRRNTPATLDRMALADGLETVRRSWSDGPGRSRYRILADLIDGYDGLVDAFSAQRPVTLCHGDPRAANIAFTGAGEPILVDWQQVALQFGEADVAWLAATSLEPPLRRSIEADLVAEYGGDYDRYRLGLVLPALAVLLLVQRTIDSPRTGLLVETSLDRITAAVADNR